MKKLLIICVALLGLTIVDVGTAQAFGGRRRARVTYAPAPSVTVAQGQTGAGYRTYSYEPGTGYQAYSYQPASSYIRSANRTPASGFRDAGAKIRGEY